MNRTRQARTRRPRVMRGWRKAALVPALALVAGVFGLPVQAAHAVDLVQGSIVNEDPVNYTPQILDGVVHALATTGPTMLAGGSFTQVQDRAGTVFARSNLVAFDATNGAINTAFNPTFNGMVESLVVSPDNQSVFVGGQFGTVNGVSQYSITKLRLADGSIDPTFKPKRLDGRVFSMILANNVLYIAGSFAHVGSLTIGGVAALNPTTGATDQSFNVPFAGQHRSGTTSVQKIDVTPDGTRMVAIGNFTTVGGLDRDQLALIDLTGATPSVANWETDRYKAQCSTSFNSYMHDVSFSPDGSYFVIVTTGAYFANTLCDTSARFETGLNGNGIQPTWVNYTGGDTTWSVAITGAAVYVGGHFRWQNNPYTGDRPGPGAIPRAGLAALDPATGMPFSWNPTRELGKGVFDMLATPTGLWIGHDTSLVYNEVHKKVAFFPLAGGQTPTRPSPGGLPSSVYQIGQPSAATTDPILYRVNAGGPTVKATEKGNAAPDWVGDTDDAPAPWHNGGNTAESWSKSASLGSTVPSTTPADIFKTDRTDPADATEMTWNFPVPAGTPVEVRLYFVNQDPNTVGRDLRTFDVDIDGTYYLRKLDVYREFGNRVGGMKPWYTTSDGSVDITFHHQINNPTIAGIEILRICGSRDTTTSADTFTARTFDGTNVGAATPISTAGTAWSQARGSFMLSGTLYTGWSDGRICGQSFDGTTLGTMKPINFWGNTFGNDLRNLSGMFFTANRIFYTVSGSSTLYWRWFNPVSNTIGAVANVASGNVTGIDFSLVGGMFLDNTKLYWATYNNGVLHRIDWNPATLAPVAGTKVDVSGVSDGVSWKQQGLATYVAAGTPAPNESPRAFLTPNCTELSCVFSSAGSGDADGTIASYLWDFGDGSTSSAQTPSHVYAAKGVYTVSLTVVDNNGASSSYGQTLSVAPAPKPPVASFTASCVKLVCNVDGTASSDPDGTVQSWAWDFGDGTTGSGATASRTYSNPGTYTITLTVTDNSGMTASTTRSVTVIAAATAISFLGSDKVNAGGSTYTVHVPSTVAGGDGLLLAVTNNNPNLAVSAPTGVTGWTQVGTVNIPNQIVTTVWKKVAASSDAGGAVTLTVAGTGSGFRMSVDLLAYRGTSTVDPVSAFAGIRETVSGTTHTTPVVTVPSDNSWVVSLWGEKNSSTTTLTPDGSVTARNFGCSTGGGHICSLLGDSNGPVAGGSSAGGAVATSDQTNATDTMWTIVLAPDA